MYESAYFNSSRTLTAFGGCPMPDHCADCPSHRGILSYLTSFAETYGLTDRIESGVEVRGVEKNADGTWTVTWADGQETVHGQVVVCPGSQCYPDIPDVPGDFTGEIRHSVDYRSADEFRGRRVLVVGAGASGCDIACDATRTAGHVVISMCRVYGFIPRHVLGRAADTPADGGPKLPVWLAQKAFGPLLRILNSDVTCLGLQKPDRKLFETHPVVNSILLHHLLMAAADDRKRLVVLVSVKNEGRAIRKTVHQGRVPPPRGRGPALRSARTCHWLTGTFHGGNLPATSSVSTHMQQRFTTVDIRYRAGRAP